MELEGKIALVTGAGGGNRGQGRVIAQALAAEGADVAVNDINLEYAEATASEVKTTGMLLLRGARKHWPRRKQASYKGGN